MCGTGTGVGKTMASTVLCNALKADYWKPIQTGIETDSDSRFVQQHTNYNITIHSEAYLLKEPASPHYAANLENKQIELNNVSLPQTNNRLVIEGAGGLLVPINENQTQVDVIEHLNAPVILVTNEYLGSINHTLLSVELLRHKKISLLGILFSGQSYRDNEEVIIRFSGCRHLGRVAHTQKMDNHFFSQQADVLKEFLNTYFQL